MREIKFRAWDDVSKVMSFSNFEQFDDMMGFRFSHFETEKPIYMQCTGIRDKNGKEIYEGDILKGKIYDYSPAKRFIGVLEYGYSGFLIKGVKQYKGMIDHPNAAYEVIGNIYENPDLIQVGGE
ncbi:hypothetical protein J5TS2_36450 [Brevibacillus halotolerans]|uniref:YopX family protein n=1 Tax=Brevibacillus halotolerans TaxID=1507437 RepID=UPI001AFE1F99|nr:YopX family protein [Brevibacillus halotolerans]GIO02977.1 hypothetical protein J5TS2_36450 [Brevibacillus halotolerans]